ncbi:hypothetical protein ES705_29067 [subsurface metagenome]
MYAVKFAPDGNRYQTIKTGRTWEYTDNVILSEWNAEIYGFTKKQMEGIQKMSTERGAAPFLEFHWCPMAEQEEVHAFRFVK